MTSTGSLTYECGKNVSKNAAILLNHGFIEKINSIYEDIGENSF